MTIAEPITRAGLGDGATIKAALPELTYPVTIPLERAGITTIGGRRKRSDAEAGELVGERRLSMLKAAQVGVEVR